MARNFRPTGFDTPSDRGEQSAAGFAPAMASWSQVVLVDSLSDIDEEIEYLMTT
jgi:hypothetical protein